MRRMGCNTPAPNLILINQSKLPHLLKRAIKNRHNHSLIRKTTTKMKSTIINAEDAGISRIVRVGMW